MTNTVNTAINVDLTGNVPQVSQRFEQSINGFANSGNRRLTVMARSTRALGRQVDVLGNRVTAFATGAAATAALNYTKNFNANITRLGTNANISDEKLATLKQTIAEVANQEDIRLDATQILDAVDTLIGKTGDVDHAINNVRNLGLTIAGFGADARSAGGLVAQYWEKGIRAPDDVLATNDRIFTQFSKGSLSAADIARVAPELFSTIQKMGPGAIAEMGALAQLFTKTTGNAEKSVTAVKAVFKTFSDDNKLKILENSGIKVFEDAEKKILRPTQELLRDIVETADSSTLLLAKVFESEALQGIKSLLTEENRALLDDLTVGSVDFGRTQVAAAKNAETLNAALRSIGNVLKNMAVDRLTDPLVALANALNKMDPKLIENLVTASIAAVGAIAAIKVTKAIIGKKQPEQSKGGNPLIDAASGLAPIPVFVVNNLPGLLKKKGGAPLLSQGKKLSNFSMLKNQTPKTLAAMGVRTAAMGAGYVGAAGLAGYGVGTLLNKTLIEGTEFSDAIGRGIAKALAAIGNDNAQAALHAERKFKVFIELEGKDASAADVTRVEGDDMAEVFVGGAVLGGSMRAL